MSPTLHSNRTTYWSPLDVPSYDVMGKTGVLNRLWWVCLLRHVRREWALLSFHSVCLSVWMSVGHSETYSLPRLINHNQSWSAGIYLSSDPCKPFWIPYLSHFRCQREKHATHILATVNVTLHAIWLVCLSVYSHNLKNHTAKFHQILCMLPEAVARPSSDGAAISYVFPVLWVTSYLHTVEQMGHNQSQRRV